MKVLCLLPDRNTDGNDWAGAFRPEAEALVKLYGAQGHLVELVQIDVSQPRPGRAQQLARALREAAQGPAVGLFAALCHGWRDGIQLGYGRAEAPRLAALLAGAAAPGAAVVLYCCSTADPDPSDDPPGAPGGFAEVLHTALSACVLPSGSTGASCTVDAHDRRGHTTMNPYVYRHGPRGGLGWLVPPGSERWARWSSALHDQRSVLRLRYPLMTREELAAHLDAAP